MENKLPKKNLILKGISILSPLLFLFLWEVLARYQLLDTRLFSSPSAILTALPPLIQSGELFWHTYISLKRVFLGILLGGGLGIVLGLLMGLSAIIRALIEPLVAATFPIPKIAIMPLILLIFGLGEASKIATIAIGVFYLVLINTLAGVVNLDKVYFEVAENFGANSWQKFWSLALPGALPLIFTGIKLALGTGLLLVVAAEMSAARAGLGYMIWRAYDMFAIEEMFIALLMLSLLGYVLSYLLDFIESMIIPWKGGV
ncbi:taurine ABC transporter permease [Carboxydothermus islandicus]|uniref:Taurine ABC transporter permease n=1 Tax=Carboxydothermus islandicus TaxID=661089 RepID=A0A1L8D1V8_9THEO|nr:ABC transporter permease [Carboxydothermus islandicus]GAV25148.1 taurine ABC transporter permease [Carboxydothermus islandicus]